MLSNGRLLSITLILSVAILVVSLMRLPSSLGIANADPATPQMMGGMDNHQGTQGMTHGMMRDNVPPGVKPQDLPAPNSKGARLTAEYCAGCHSLPSPSMHTAKKWQVVADRMFRRMSAASTRGMMGMPVNEPSREQQKEILVYLQAHALKSISPGALGSPNSPGAAAFSSSCSQCHALPNPRLHSAAGWPPIVRKMQSFAKQMGKKVITDQQAREIENYLASPGSR